MRMGTIFGVALALAFSASVPALADGWRHGGDDDRYDYDDDWDDDRDDDWDDDWGDRRGGRGGPHGFVNGGWVAPGGGPCRVEREWRPNGGYREEIECFGRPAAVPQLPAFIAPNRGPSLTITIPFD